MFFLSFKLLDLIKAKKLNLTWVRNVHGDEINALNCRSIWKDKYNHYFRIKELYYIDMTEEHVKKYANQNRIGKI